MSGYGMSVNDTTIWWQVYPLGFTGAPIRPSNEGERALTPRLDAIIPWLDYLIDMGANGLLLGRCSRPRPTGTTRSTTIASILGSAMTPHSTG